MKDPPTTIVKHVAPFIWSVVGSNFISLYCTEVYIHYNVECCWVGLAVDTCAMCRVLLGRAGHPLVTSTTPDVSLKHTDTGGDDDVLEKGHYHDDH